MAPVRDRKNHTKSKGGRTLPASGHAILHKVQGGRLGRATLASRRNAPAKKTAAELDADMDKYWKGDTQEKELFPTLLNDAPRQPKSLSKANQNNAGKELLPGLLQSNHNKPLRKVAPRKRRKASGKTAYFQSVNKRQAHIHRVKDRITKRMLALRTNPNEAPAEDLRNETTVSYVSGRLDDQPTEGPSKLNFSISCGFWSYTPTFSPSKVFTFSLEKFSSPSHVQKALLNTIDNQTAAKEVGIDLLSSSIAIIGYEVLFPKGYRYNSVNHFDIKNIDPITYVSSDTKVLINTPCALREFFTQAQRYACDVFDNVSIPVIARIGLMSPDPTYGGVSATQFTPTWRSDKERKSAAEEKRLALEQ